MERWLPVVGYEGLYEVSSQGRVRSLLRTIEAVNGWGSYTYQKPGRILKPKPCWTGYLGVVLYKEGKRKHRVIQRLVCEAFIGPRPPGHEVNHIDCVRCNNNVENLEWVTRLQNAAHREQFGKSTGGENNPNARLSLADVQAIRQSIDTRAAELARDFEVSVGTIHHIRRHFTWR